MHKSCLDAALSPIHSDRQSSISTIWPAEVRSSYLVEEQATMADRDTDLGVAFRALIATTPLPACTSHAALSCLCL